MAERLPSRAWRPQRWRVSPRDNGAPRRRPSNAVSPPFLPPSLSMVLTMAWWQAPSLMQHYLFDLIFVFVQTQMSLFDFILKFMCDVLHILILLFFLPVTVGKLTR
jgi:hypothetical protein